MPTRLIRSLLNITAKQQGGVITIGNFDGVHIGHQQLIAHVKEQAAKQQIPCSVITFEPHPFEFFAGSNLTIPRITRLREKFKALSACGVDNVIILPFNQKLANTSASDFITQFLHQKLAIKRIIVGKDFHFGHKREGDILFLERAGKELGFSVETFPTVYVEGERASSTRLRQALNQWNKPLILSLLGHPFAMLGRIRLGDQRGRQWGFPTANIYLHRHLTPVRGVFTVYMHGILPKPIPGVANIGTRPTLDGTRTLLEVHLLNFNQEIYGRYVRVEFCEKLREEIRFPTIDLLKAQIAKDVDEARDYFKQQGKL